MWEKAMPAEDVPLHGGRCWSHAHGRIGVFRTAQGLFAVDNTCPHYPVDLHSGEVVDGRVICPWHRRRFSLETGHCGHEPHFDIAVYPIKEADGFIWIDPEAGTRRPR